MRVEGNEKATEKAYTRSRKTGTVHREHGGE